MITASAGGVGSLPGLTSSALLTAARQAVAQSQAIVAAPVPAPPPAVASTTQQMSTAVASSTGATTPTTAQAPASSPIPVPSWVTKTTTTNGKVYWWIAGQSVTQSGAQVYVPGHWVPEGSVTSPTLDPTKVTVAPAKTPEQEAADAALAMVMTGTPSFVMTQDDFQSKFVNDVVNAGVSDSDVHYVMGDGGALWRQAGTKLSLIPDGSPEFTWQTYTNLTGTNAQYNGKTIMLLTPDEALLAKNEGKTPHDWVVAEVARVINAKVAADKAAAAAAKSPTNAPPAGGTNHPITPIPGSGTGTATSTTSNTTRNIIIAAAAAAAAYLLLS